MSGDALSAFKAMAFGLGAMVLVGNIVDTETMQFNRLVRGKKPIKTVKPVVEPVAEPIPTTSSPLLPELSAIPSNFDISAELQASWGTGAIPGTTAPDDTGAFRFICNASHLLKDDPIVYPGRPGASHLHQFFGNTEANAHSTYASLRQSGKSTCNSPLNRSAYWMPAMMDGAGSVVVPDFVSIYYKRRPASDPTVSDPTNPRYMGKAVPLPNGLRFVFGYDMLAGRIAGGNLWFNCDGPTGVQGQYKTITEAAANCPTEPVPIKQWDGSIKQVYNKLGAVITAPDCWDGKNLDSPNHRDHMSSPGYGFWGYLKCPDTHPYVIPGFTMATWYSVDPNLNKWRLSSDEMHPELPPGTTFHADWFGAWDNTIMAMWMDNCINKLLSCSGGDLGNGKQMRMFTGFSWEATTRLVPVPSA